jgi:hypothetical protein
METDIGNPIDYNPDILDKEDEMHPQHSEQQQQQPEDEYYYYPPAPPPPTIPQTQKIDLFNDLDKTAYIVIFVAFILGFFMGKTMQPVILRPG